MSENPEKPAWIERKSSIDLIYRGLWVACGALAFADFLYRKHGTFRFEEMPAFYGIFGFVCFLGIVLAGKYLRKIVGRKEDYYDR
ncbi:MAG: hypothetical protein RL477_2249 [Pseudomonadota bacterium]|jgi:hypothetical protein